MRYLLRIKLGKKIALSFGVLIALIIVNAVVVGMAAFSIGQQIGQQNRVVQVFGEVDKIRLIVSRFVNTHSRESAQQVFLRLLAVRGQIEAANQALEDPQLRDMLSLLDDFRLNFQKYVVESEQKAALASRARRLGQHLTELLYQTRRHPSARTHADGLDDLVFLIMSLHWSGRDSGVLPTQDVLQHMASIEPILAQLRQTSQATRAQPNQGLLLFRIERDATDYLASFASYQRYQQLNADTENRLTAISERIQDGAKQISVSVGEVIQARIRLAVGLTLAIFWLSALCAMVLTRYLGKEILRPIRALADVTRQIASGNLQARATVLVDDEIGDLSRSFNLMTQSLAQSRSEWLAQHAELEAARAELEQRVQRRTAQLLAANDSLTQQMAELARAQSELELANQAIAARELLVRQIIDTAPIAVFLVDRDGRITQANNSMVDMFGYPMDTLLGMEYMALVDPGETSLRGENMQALLSGEVPLVDLERKLRRANGEEFWAHFNGKRFCGMAGERVGLIGVIADISAMKAHQQQLEQIAHFDALTGMPNRLFLADRLRQALLQCQRTGNMLAVAYLDLDGFKKINDTQGHVAGDALLVSVSRRMRDSLRESDTLARIGGDEFVAVMVDLQSVEDCKPLLGRLLQAACSPVNFTARDGPIELQVSASIGVTLFPRDRSDADLLMRHADQAMYVAKESGKNRFHLFDVAQDEAIKTQHEDQLSIRNALHNQELVLYYQPKVNMKTGLVTGAEALIRWAHSQRGLLAPASFLPTIENQPISIEVGEWVISTALAQMSVWQAQGLRLPVSVNIGARQLQQDGFAARLGQLLALQPAVPAHWLQLEVLETSALEDVVKVSAAMRACQVMGVSFALDDFGTGYSSLTYLKRLPAETLKIDQSFVRDMLDDPGDLVIVSGVIGLAKSFGREVIAEGVETRAHGELLLLSGCELAQGFGIAAPMPAVDVPSWVLDWQQGALWRA